MLRQVGLPDVLQMECFGRKSSLLEINSHTGTGRIFIENGSIIHAETGSLQGETALFRLLGISGGEIHLRPFVKPARLTVDGHWESLLMEAMRLRDEATANTPTEPFTEVSAAAAEPASPPQPITKEGPSHTHRFAEEVLLCSATGEVLYEWQVAGVEARAKLLDLLANKSNSIGTTLGLGQANRLVIDAPDTRVVALLNPECKVFVRIGQKEM